MALSRWLLWLSALIAVVQLGRLTAFMADGRARQHAVLPQDTFVRHSCLSAYHRADELGRWGTPDLYQADLYRGQVGMFQQETFEYPPPFLLLAHAADAAAGHDFARLRLLWFAGMTVLLLAAVGLAAQWVGEPAPLWLAPALVAATPTMLSLQYGNFHLAAVTLAVLAMIALGEDRWVRWVPLGGALLAFVIWAKVFPLLLLVPLLVQRRRRALFWIAAFGFIWPLLAVVVLGPAPLTAFFAHQLGDVASGAAFPHLAENERLIAANLSAYGVVQKVARLCGLAPPSATWIGLLYAAALTVLLAGAARRADGRLASMRLWLATLFLGALASPFAPEPYAAFAGLWLLTFLVPGGKAAALLAAWLALAVMIFTLPVQAGPALLVLSLITQVGAMAVAVRSLLQS
jgi:hypothetical protein